MATIGLTNASVTPLVSGVARSDPSLYQTNSQKVYSFSSPASVTMVSLSSPIDSVVASLFFTPPADQANSPKSCGKELSETYSYFWGCTKLPSSDFKVIVSGDGAYSGPPISNTSYTIVAASLNPTTLTSTPQSITQSPPQTRSFFTVPVDVSQSLQVNITTSPSAYLRVELWSNKCSTGGDNQIIDFFDCFGGTCLLSVSWSNGELPDESGIVNYIITVTGTRQTTFSISYTAGEASNCVTPPETQLCSISWSIWDYGTGEAGFQAQEQASIRYYNQLVEAFCPPCACPEISKACNQSLVTYACTQTYRACNDDGFQTSTCQETCSDVETNCGLTFAQVGLPALSCNHNSYYLPTDDICLAIYGIGSGESDVVLWVVIVIVVICVILILIGVALYLAFLKYKVARQLSSYETIAEVSE